MFETFENAGAKFNGVVLLAVSILFMILAGGFFGGTYYVVEKLDDGLRTVDCTIDGNVYVSSCQELFTMTLYPVLAIRSVLVWLSYLMIFLMVVGLLIVGYQNGKSPVMIGLMIVFLVFLVYGSIELANGYRVLLENDIFRDMMTPFTVYNRIMLNLPWFTFIVSLLSTGLSIVNFQRNIVNTKVTSEELDY